MSDIRIVNQLRALGGLLAITGAVEVLTDDSGASQEVSAALKKHTPYMVNGDAPFHIERGVFEATAATTSHMRIPGDTVNVLWTGESTSFAIIRATAVTTKVYIVEVEADTEPVPARDSTQYAG